MSLAILTAKDRVPVIHEWDCRAIRANVEGDTRAVAGNDVDEVRERYREPVESTPSQIDRTARYLRCKICSPAIPESEWQKPREWWRAVTAGNLRPAHIGKAFRGLGTLESITFGAGYVHCIGSDSSLVCTTAGALEYRREA